MILNTTTIAPAAEKKGAPLPLQNDTSFYWRFKRHGIKKSFDFNVIC